MSKLEETLKFLIKEYPESENIIAPFGAFLTKEEDIANDLKKANIPALPVDTPLPVKFTSFPLSQKENLIILNPLIKTLKTSFPNLTEEVILIEKTLRLKAFYVLCEKYFLDKSKKSKHITEYLQKLTTGAKAPISSRRLKERYEEFHSIIELLIIRINRIVLAHMLCEIPAKEEDKLSKTCPYCNGKPSTSVITQKEGARDLICTECGRFWRFRRTACPNCTHEEENNLQMVYIDDKDKERAVLCSSCNHYILEVDIRDRVMNFKHVEAFTLALGYLDIIMLEKNAESIQ